MTFELRRVVTKVDGDGAVIASDGPPPNLVSAPSGFGVAEVLWLDAWPQAVDDGGDRTSPGYPLEPPPGGLSSRVIRMPASGDWLRVEGDDPDAPGMHATDTLDLMVVLDGEITLGLPDCELTVSAGQAVVQQGTKHRWKVAGDQPCTYWVTMLRPQPGTDPGLSVVGGDSPVRRIVTGGPIDDFAPIGIGGGGTTMVDVWHTGGKVASVTQGGDSTGPWQLEPLGGGVSLRWLEIPGGQESASMWHTTATIDVDVILSGRMALELPGGRVELGPGDVVVQRGTNHRWIPLETVQFAALMIAVP